MTTLRAGEKLDHYLIESVVARSGMASIFRATDERTGKTVAIKIPHPEMEADPVFYDRFRREQEIGEKLDHPGVMKVLPNRRSQPVLHGNGMGRRAAAAATDERAEEVSARNER